MPDIDTTEPVRLAAEALWEHAADCPAVDYDCCARSAVTAALPALAEQFAALILTERDVLDIDAARAATDREAAAIARVALGLTTAARLVREAAEVTG